MSLETSGALLRSENPREAAIAIATYKTETTLSDFINLLLSAWPEVNSLLRDQAPHFADADTVSSRQASSGSSEVRTIDWSPQIFFGIPRAEQKRRGIR